LPDDPERGERLANLGDEPGAAVVGQQPTRVGIEMLGGDAEPAGRTGDRTLRSGQPERVQGTGGVGRSYAVALDRLVNDRHRRDGTKPLAQGADRLADQGPCSRRRGPYALGRPEPELTDSLLGETELPLEPHARPAVAERQFPIDEYGQVPCVARGRDEVGHAGGEFSLP
jgi:hypothetical protein